MQPSQPQTQQFGKRRSEPVRSPGVNPLADADIDPGPPDLVQAFVPGRGISDYEVMKLAARLGVFAGSYHVLISLSGLIMVGGGGDPLSNGVPLEVLAFGLLTILPFGIAAGVAAWRLWLTQPLWAANTILVISVLHTAGAMQSGPLRFSVAIVTLFLAVNSLRGVLALRRVRQEAMAIQQSAPTSG
jgi:hypothetical protein